MVLHFNDIAMPLLVEMATNPDTTTPRPFLEQRLCELHGLDAETDAASVRSEANQWIEWLIDDGLITLQIERDGMGEIFLMLDPKLTPKALQQHLKLWPTDSDHAERLVEAIAASLDQLANDATTDDDKNRFAAAANVVRDGVVSIGAGLITAKITGQI